MVKEAKGCLKIIGAGPGDPELFTIKGAKALHQAEVILYDALVSKSLLDSYASPGCKLVYVGKRKAKKEFPQEEINKLIVFYCLRYKNVVRLKGGDPFVYGRGHEEMEYAVNCGIAVQIIPGISSAIAAPSSVGIPVTKRGVNESFWVVTGMLASGDISEDIHHAARSSATVIVLMGMTHLEKITSIFSNIRGESEPVAVIEHATWPGQKVVSGNVNTIVDLVNNYQISSPGVIVIGKVVNESLLLKTIQQENRATFMQ